MQCTLEFYRNGRHECGKPATHWELDEIDKKTEYPVCQGHIAPGFTYREINEDSKKTSAQ